MSVNNDSSGPPERGSREEELEEICLDLDVRLDELIKATGKVSPSHGGYKIEINDPLKFPWTEVIVTLICNGYRLTIERINGKYVIEAYLHMRK